MFTCTGGGNTESKTVYIGYNDKQTIYLAYNKIPAFTYTGNYQIVDDNDSPITTSKGNWKIRFLTSGTLTFTDLRDPITLNKIDVFLVGGGGNGAQGLYACGGGGGYTKTVRKQTITTNSAYNITIGGSIANTTAFGQTANAGGSGSLSAGGAGGSGGGGYNGNGGSNGGNGGSADRPGGKGQGTTTREFGESNRKLYAGGGGGNGRAYGADGGGNGQDTNSGKMNGTANTGSGGGGGYSTYGTGGSGIVVIRNAR